ncbi:hypothetical protein [Cyclobacterium salsum]|uniref:hypothetical protein n=1 Tax=Cyclobacterium salsum TaxID=2666329 RepID=UPI001390DA88|nr:hypothetical protein [Cyclobacterium salsum]
MEFRKRDTVNEPDLEYTNYSYADYLNWQMEEVVELIKGQVFKKAAAAPERLHQKVSVQLSLRLTGFLRVKNIKFIPHPLMYGFLKTPTKMLKFTIWYSRIVA